MKPQFHWKRVLLLLVATTLLAQCGVGICTQAIYCDAYRGYPGTLVERFSGGGVSTPAISD